MRSMPMVSLQLLALAILQQASSRVADLVRHTACRLSWPIAASQICMKLLAFDALQCVQHTSVAIVQSYTYAECAARLCQMLCMTAKVCAGSVIFSQCVLAIRAGVRTRLQGYGLFALQASTFFIPFNLVHFLPNFYYGALLMVIGIDIFNEWLFATWPRVKKAEFVLSWLSFICTLVLTSLMPVQVRWRRGSGHRVQLLVLSLQTFVMCRALLNFIALRQTQMTYASRVATRLYTHCTVCCTPVDIRRMHMPPCQLKCIQRHQLAITHDMQGLEAGIVVGIVMCSLHFAYEYSVMQLVSFTVTSSRSNSMLPYRYRQVLSMFRSNMIAVSVSGATP
jgi:hypothetical protein